MTMLTCSTTYHRGNWPRKTREWLRRLDHSSIFILIAGTYTPFCMLALENKTALRLMVRPHPHASVGLPCLPSRRTYIDTVLCASL